MSKKLIEVLKYCASPEADCTKCERWSLDIESKCVEDLLLSAAIALEEKQATSDENKRWIPVTERLPDNCKEHLCLCNIDGHTEYPFAMVLRYYLVDEKPHFQHESEHGLHVTHWMPIPEAPSGERRTDA